MNLFRHESYKKVMSEHLKIKGQRGALSRAAEALGCQRSYLSRIMSSEMHLTPDQAYLLGRFWKLPPLEQEYFQTLVDFERASNIGYREYVEAKLAEIRRKHESLTERIQRPNLKVTTEKEAIYFSSWQWSAIHFLTSSPKYRTVEALSERVGMNKESVTVFLTRLKDLGFVKSVGKNWEYAGGEFHLPKESPFVIQHHTNWRNRAALDAQLLNLDGIHYTNIQTASQKDIATLREMTFDFISSCKQVLDPSSPEEAVVVLCDVFKL